MIHIITYTKIGKLNSVFSLRLWKTRGKPDPSPMLLSKACPNVLGLVKPDLVFIVPGPSLFAIGDPGPSKPLPMLSCPNDGIPPGPGPFAEPPGDILPGWARNPPPSGGAAKVVPTVTGFEPAQHEASRFRIYPLNHSGILSCCPWAIETIQFKPSILLLCRAL